MRNNPTKRVRVHPYANTKEANSQSRNRSRHFVGGIRYSVEFRSSTAEDHENLLAVVRRARPASEMMADNLLRVFIQHEGRLLDWMQRSPSNAQRFVLDPVGAARAANIGLDQQTLKELEALSSALASKVKEDNNYDYRRY